MAIKLYTKEYVRTLPVITEVKNHFIRTFGGKLQIVDGIKESTKAFVFKVSDSSDVVLQLRLFRIMHLRYYLGKLWKCLTKLTKNL